MRRAGIIIWLGLFGMGGVGVACGGEALIGWAFVLAALMAVITFLGMRGRDLVLVHPRLYRALLVPTLLAAFATAVGAGGTIAIGGDFRGFIVISAAKIVMM